MPDERAEDRPAAPNGDDWRLLLVHQGYLGILDTRTNGARDVALGGPGFSFPVFAWDGANYEPAGRMIPDTDFGAATVVP